ncbi:MAG TPA: hypothetical protein VFT96_13520 [Gemmatimonadaceae bacterium]|nr:hypothetical protein [Gemmatimonadaceae bacterium]
MRHGVMNQGGFEANIRLLAPGRQTVVVDGAERPLPQWPADVNGIRFGALERRGRWLITRLEFADQDVILHHPVLLDAIRHLGGPRRPGANVVLLTDDLAERLLDDILEANGAQTRAVALVVNRVNQVRRAAREQAERATPEQPSSRG